MVYFYENEWPEVDELVMVVITNVSDMGIMCQLLEYNDIEGFISMSRYKRLYVGKKYILRISHVDMNTNYIELTHRHLSQKEVEEGMIKYNQAKTVDNIMKRIAYLKELDIHFLYIQMVYPLINDYDTAYDGFKHFNIHGNIFDYYKALEADVIELMLKLIKQQFTIQPIKLSLNIQVYSYVNGIIDIKYALNKGKACISKEDQLQIQLVSSPIFNISLITFHEKEGTDIIYKVANVIQQEIKQLGGIYICDQPIYIIN